MKLLLLVLVGYCTQQVVAQGARSTGKEECPCVSLNMDHVPLKYRTPASCLNYFNGGETYCFSPNYGSSECRTHDDGLAPYCNMLGFPGNPDWCSQNWCWVDPTNCKSDHYKSSFFPELDLHYSYRTCGGINSFVAWFDEGSLNNDFTDLIGLVESYVVSTKTSIENSFENVNAAIGGIDMSECHDSDSCNCPECKYNADWKLPVEFGASNFVYHQNNRGNSAQDDILKCVATTVETTYLRNAKREYHNESRIAYQYFGHGETGAMLQWPASQFCSETFDARYRPWYSSAVSGPKDIVIIIDVSGSMKGDKIELAREAAKAVLKTLTWADYVSIVTFNDNVEDVYPLVQATGAKVSEISSWIARNVHDGGGTNYDDPIERAFKILRDGRDSHGRTSCTQLILFLTDGEPNSGGYSESRFRAKIEQYPHVAVFAYGLGTGIAQSGIEYLKGMACISGGIFYSVENIDQLPATMAKYYEYFSSLQDGCKLSWVKYEDALTGTDLIAGCTAIYDYTSAPVEVIGVTCFDLNVIVGLDVLQTCSSGQSYPKFVDTLLAESQKCSSKGSKVTDQCELERLRRKAGYTCTASSPCSVTSPNNVSNCDNLSPHRFPKILLGECEVNTGQRQEDEPNRRDTVPPTGDDGDKSAGENSDGPTGEKNIVGIAVGIGISVGVLCLLLAFVAYKRRPTTGQPALESQNAYVRSNNDREDSESANVFNAEHALKDIPTAEAV